MKTQFKPEHAVFLVVLSGFLVGGEIAQVGDLVELTEREAKPLLERGKARLATADDMPAEDGEQDDQAEPDEQEDPEQADGQAEQPAATTAPRKRK